MIIDEILDRRDGCKYDPEYLVDIAETDGFDNVVKAFKSKDENAAKTALKEYVDENGYDNKLHEYIEFNDEEKKYYDDLYEAKRQCEMSHGVEIWSENECLPYIQYVEETYGKSFLPKLRLESIKNRNEIVSQI